MRLLWNKLRIVVFLFALLFLTNTIAQKSDVSAQTGDWCDGGIPDGICPSGWYCMFNECLPDVPTSSCPAECRQGSSCGNGYQGASGCSGCNSNQVCCKANSCGAGGGGGGVGDSCSSDNQCDSGCCNENQGICGNCDGFICPLAKIYCPAGTVRGSTVVASQCESYRCSNNVGSAQQMGSCCDFYTPPRECGDWYDCPTPSNPNKVCRDCTQDPPWCNRYNYDTYNCVSTCNITAPTITSINRNSATSATINWTTGTGGTSQRIYMSQDKNQVLNNCSLATSPGCVVNQTGLSAATQTYTTGNVLAAGSVYYINIINDGGASCTASSNSTNTYNPNGPLPYLSSCTLSPSSLSLQISQTGIVTSNVDSSSEITSVSFASNNPSVTVTTPDNSYPYTTTATAISAGSASIISTVYFSGGYIACTNTVGGNGRLSGGGPDGYNGGSGANTGSGTTTSGASSDTDGGGGSGNNGNSSVTTTNLSAAWWQLKDSDLTSNGSINSTIPSGNYFILPGIGGYSGIPAYTTTTNLTSNNVSLNRWTAQSDNKSKPIFDYNYFENLIPKDVVFNTVPSSSVAGNFFASGGTQSYGYYWYKYDGGAGNLNLRITSSASIGNRKVILLVKNAHLFIDSTINLNDGLGFFMTIVDKNIEIDPTVGGGVGPNLEGFYICDDLFRTGAGTNSFYLRGAAVAYGGIVMGRDLGVGNSSTPAELFEYAPDQSILFPGKLATRKINWKEVAP